MEETRSGVQSVDVAVCIVRVLVDRGQAISLGELARLAGIAPSKAHRYLASLVKGGFVERDPVTGHYGLGPLALKAGLVALARADVVRLALPALPSLCDQLAESVGLCTWTREGPLVLAWERARRAISLSLHTGYILPMLTSATGHAFLTFRDCAECVRVLEAELAAMPGEQRDEWTSAKLDALRRETRARGYGRVSGEVAPGVIGLATPIRDHTGKTVATLTSAITEQSGDSLKESRTARVLIEESAAISANLGYGEGGPSGFSRIA